MNSFIVKTKSGSFYLIEPHGVFTHHWSVKKIGDNAVYFLAGIGDSRDNVFYEGVDYIKRGKCKNLVLFFLDDRENLEKLLHGVRNPQLLMQSLGHSTRIEHLYREF